MKRHFPTLLKKLGYEKEEFQEALKDFRRAHGYTYYDMALLIGGVHPSTVCRWEKGKTYPMIRGYVERLLHYGVIERRI